MKNSQSELAVHAPQGALTKAQPQQGLSIEQVFQAVIEKQISPEHIAVMRELLAMSAEQKFNAAFVELQRDLPVIVASSVIPNRGKYERFEDVMHQIGPILTKHGFTVSFSMDFKENRILETCHLSHGGHTRSNSFAVRSGKADSDTQADCKAATTAKRNALLNALNIVIRQDCMTNEDDDATLEGDPNAKITPAQVEELRHRCEMTESNVHSFLKFAGAGKFEDIRATRYDELDLMLRKKESQGR
jgi:ERF superfamily